MESLPLNEKGERVPDLSYMGAGAAVSLPDLYQHMSIRKGEEIFGPDFVPEVSPSRERKLNSLAQPKRRDEGERKIGCPLRYSPTMIGTLTGRVSRRYS